MTDYALKLPDEYGAMDADGYALDLTDDAPCCCQGGCKGTTCCDGGNATNCGFNAGTLPKFTLIMLGSARYYRRIVEVDGSVSLVEKTWGDLNFTYEYPPPGPNDDPCRRGMPLTVVSGGGSSGAEFRIGSNYATQGIATDQLGNVVPFAFGLNAIINRSSSSGGENIWGFGFPAFIFQAHLVQRYDGGGTDPNAGPIPGNRIANPVCQCWFGESFTLNMGGSYDFDTGFSSGRFEWSVQYTCVARMNFEGCRDP